MATLGILGYYDPDDKKYRQDKLTYHEGIEMLTVVNDAVYEYVAAHPVECRGHKYKAHRIIIDLPTYQEKVLVEGLTGPDEGAWFSLSLVTFANKFKQIVKVDNEQSKNEKGKIVLPIEDDVIVNGGRSGSGNGYYGNPNEVKHIEEKVAGKYTAGSGV